MTTSAKPPRKRYLTPKESAFVNAFAGNASEAARKAGYGSNGAVGPAILKRPHVIEAIRKRSQRVDASIASRSDLDVNVPVVMSRLGRQAFWTKVIKDENENILARLKASELLGKSEGDFVDRHRVENEDGKPITFEVKMPDSVESILNRYREAISASVKDARLDEPIDVTPRQIPELKRVR